MPVRDQLEVGPLAGLELDGVEPGDDGVGRGHGLDPGPAVHEDHPGVAAAEGLDRELEDALDGLVEALDVVEVEREPGEGLGVGGGVRHRVSCGRTQKALRPDPRARSVARPVPAVPVTPAARLEQHDEADEPHPPRHLERDREDQGGDQEHPEREAPRRRAPGGAGGRGAGTTARGRSQKTMSRSPRVRADQMASRRSSYSSWSSRPAA